MHLNRSRIQSTSARVRWSLVAVASAMIAGHATPSGQGESVVLTVRLPDRPAAGARLFVQKSCARCHTIGAQASAQARVGPDLGRLLLSGTVLDLAGALWNHAPVMRDKMQALKIQPPTITSTEMADIVALLTAYRYDAAEVSRPANAEAGRRVFMAKRCATCHNPNGSRWDGLGPGLQKYRGRSSAIFLAQAMWNHGPEMASVMDAQAVPWPKFAPGEMDDLVAYLQAGGSASDRAEYFQPGSPRRGAELFSSKRCIACHAVRDRGGRGGPDLGLRGHELVASVPTIAGLMWNHSETMAAEFDKRGIPQITFSGQEMVDVIAYLYFLNYATVRATPARGEKLFAARCSACHATGGKGTGPDLAAVPHLDEPFAIIAAMWNHAPMMASEIKKRGLTWPRFEPGEAADLVAFLLSTHQTTGSSPSGSGR
jgi:mono/diheme cytochrome c family protein